VTGREYRWRGDFQNHEVSALHAAAFKHPAGDHDWVGQVSGHSVGWVTAREDGELIGFVNVPWDGAEHAFIVDTIVSAGKRRQGVGRELVARAATGARAAGCWVLHVDFEDDLGPFYFDACGFKPTSAGLILFG
jgi:GNAT superfamily N-acetyltransferase